MLYPSLEVKSSQGIRLVISRAVLHIATRLTILQHINQLQANTQDAESLGIFGSVLHTEQDYKTVHR